MPNPTTPILAHPRLADPGRADPRGPVRRPAQGSPRRRADPAGRRVELPALHAAADANDARPRPRRRPLITNVQIVDLDRDGIPDVLACDAVLNRVVWYRQAPRPVEGRVLGDVDLAAPCHVSAVDLNGDGDLDLVVAVLGSVYPTDEPIGKVVWLENDGKQKFQDARHPRRPPPRRRTSGRRPQRRRQDRTSSSRSSATTAAASCGWRTGAAASSATTNC